MASVTFDKVGKTYPDGTMAVQGIDLAIRDGEFMVFVGPSGCGKTTALRMVAGLEDITEGTLRIGDRVVNYVPSRDRDIAMVFQSYALYPHLSVYDNIAFGLKVKKVPKAEIERRVQEAARILGPDRRSWSASRARSRAASASASRWGGRSCASRPRSSWTSRSRTSTRSSACRCGRRSAACSTRSGRRRSMSRTTRSRR